MPNIRRSAIFCLVLFGILSFGTATAQSVSPVEQNGYPTGPATPLGAQVATLLADPTVTRAHWGIAVTTLNGAPIYGWDEGKFFRPASNAKLFTTAAAMALLGPKSTVSTTVTGSALNADGTVQGDLLLSSDGDANLSGLPFPYVPVPGETPPSPTPLKAIDDLAAQIAAKGVKHVTGSIVGDDSRWAWEPYPNSWVVDDMVWGYGAPVSSLSVNDSLITLTVRGGAKPGDAAVVTQSPDVGYYRLAADVSTGEAKSAPQVYIDRAVGSRVVTVSGQVAVGGKVTEQIAVADPPLFAALALRAELLAHGVAVDGDALAKERPARNTQSFAKQSREPVQLPAADQDRPGTKTGCVDACPVVLASRTSPTLEQDIAYTLKESQNLHAEQLLRRLGEVWGSEASGAQGARVVRQFLTDAGIDGNDFLFVDGSGLSDHDVVTPRATARLLAYAQTQPWGSIWKAAQPVGGVDGTLASRFKDPPLKGHVYAKTGTLGESRALSGYLDCASGRQVIFSIMVDNHTTFGSNDRAVMDRIVAAIAANN